MIPLDSLAVFALATICAGGLAYALIYPFLSGEVKADARRDAVAGTLTRPTRTPTKAEDASAKRVSVEDTLKELERKQKNSAKPPLNIPHLAGRPHLDHPPVLHLLGGARRCRRAHPGLHGHAALHAGGLCRRLRPRLSPVVPELQEEAPHDGLPQRARELGRRHRPRRQGGSAARRLPAHRGDRIQEPVRTEFRHIVEQTALGIPLHEAVMKLYERMPVPEANFFCIVVSISRRPAATSPRPSATSPRCCATARR